MATGLREEKKQHQRAMIVESATRRFREQGFDETRVQDIASELKISRKTFFNYFPSKDAVLDCIAAELLEKYSDWIRDLLDEPERSAPVRLLELSDKMSREVEGDQKLMAIVFRRSRLLSSEQRLLAVGRTYYELLSDLICAGQVRGDLDAHRDPLQCAELFTGVFIITTMNWLKGWWDDTASLTGRVREAVSVLLNGLAVEA